MNSSIGKLQRMYFCFFGMFAAFAGFSIPYMNHLGMNRGQIGFYMSLMMISGIVGQFVTGYVCDLKKTIKKVVVVLILILSASVTLIYSVESLELKLLMLPFIGFAQSSVAALLDSWTLELKGIGGKNYGVVRALGSLGWGLSAIVIGRFIDAYGWGSMAFIYVILSVLVLFFISRIDDVEKKVVKEHEKVTLDSIKSLFANRQYTSIVGTFLIIYIPFQAYFMFMPLLIEKYGGGRFHIGMFLLIAGLSEVPMFFGSKHLLKRFKASQLMIVSSVAFFVKVVLASSLQNVYALVSVGALQMFSFSILMFASKQLIDDVSPGHLKTSAQSISMAVFYGLSGLIMYNVAGSLSDVIGMAMTLRLLSLFSVVGIIMCVRYHQKHYKTQISSEKVI